LACNLLIRFSSSSPLFPSPLSHHTQQQTVSVCVRERERERVRCTVLSHTKNLVVYSAVCVCVSHSFHRILRKPASSNVAEKCLNKLARFK
jgi:predicted house-cleaning NTP pyrophosphatase (Maf/HAM1 superfamily)